MPDYMLADMPASKDGDRKKTFEFRMSKKVAELTQVVHMLFTRNHEKEVELDALRDAYEHEVGLVIKDANERIDALQKQVKVLEKSRSGDGTQAKAATEKMAQWEEEWRQRVSSLEKQVAEEKRECQNARDLLIQAQRDLEKLRQAQADETVHKDHALDGKCREVERLKHQLVGLERRLRDSDASNNNELLELRRENEKLRRDSTATHGNLAESERMREQISTRNKQLESEIRTLKKELVKRSDRYNSAKSGPEDSVPLPEYAEELEWLRREVQRYRNELSNREENFNRMFTQQHPVVLDKRAGKMAFADAPHVRYSVGGREPTFAVTASYPSTHQLMPTKPTMGMGMGTSQTTGSRPGSGFEERDIMGLPGSPRQSHTITARLPQLGMESRRHTAGGGAKLTKPRPLPREMLSAKAGGHG